MNFRPKRVWAVCWKEFIELRKNRGLLTSLLALPTVLILMPVGVVWSYLRDPSDPSLRAMAHFYDPNFAEHGSAVQFLLERSVSDWFSMYLLMPVFIPILISSHSIAGEKEKRTLEPLLASPITAFELLLGKSLASLIPALLISFVAFVLMCAAVDWAAWNYLHAPLLPTRMWIFGVFLVAPLFAFFGNLVAVTLSARVGDARLAQQLAGLTVLPLLGMAGAQVAGVLHAGTLYYAIVGGIVAFADLVLLFFAVQLFDRERLVSKWT